MIAPTAFLSPPPMVGNVSPTRESDASARRQVPGKHQGWGPAPSQTALVPPQPAEGRLTWFLSRSSIEVTLIQDLTSETGISYLRDRATFDAVIRRSRDAIRQAVLQDEAASPILQPALRVLDHNAVLRSYSNVTRNALLQG